MYLAPARARMFQQMRAAPNLEVSLSLSLSRALFLPSLSLLCVSLLSLFLSFFYYPSSLFSDGHVPGASTKMTGDSRGHF